MDYLRPRWMEALGDLARPPDFDELSEAIFQAVARRYSEPHRAYHNLRHIENVLEMVDFLREHALNLGAVRRAAWLHDVVYDPRSADIEARSAEYALGILGRLGDRSAGAVARMIVATRDHDTAHADLDTLVLLDSDLAILGADPERYSDYASAIRQEYFWVPEHRYREGRAEILAALLARPSIFGLPIMRRLFEQQARDNMTEELKSLQPG